MRSHACETNVGAASRGMRRHAAGLCGASAGALALGYALFRSGNCFTYFAGFAQPEGFVFLVPGLSFLAVSAAASLIAAACVVLAVRAGALRSGRLPVVFPGAALACIGLASGSGLLASLGPIAGGVVAPALFAACIVCLNLSWMELLARCDGDGGRRIYASGLCAASVLFVTLCVVPAWLASAAAGLMTAASCIVVARARRTSSFAGKAAAPSADCDGGSRPAARYRRGFARIANPMITALVMEASVSLLGGFFFGRSLFSGEAVPAAGLVIAAVSFYAVMRFVPDTVKMDRAYRAVFPVLAASVGLMPFASGMGGVFQVALSGVYNFLAFAAVYYIVRCIAETGLNAYAFGGLATMAIHGVQLAFAPTGYLLAGIGRDGAFAAVAVGVVYVLSLLLLFLTRRGASAEGAAAVQATEEPVVIVVSEEDRFAQRADELAKRCGLTRREREVLEHAARGRSATFIAEELVVSPGTVRSHLKSIYAKLDVHSKQELIDLFER
ncbi:MAG: helix-turn-helix transcriptional regulator [Slackia sp.]|nr:helix-turn-helix transcriptional regulator [Slackia sp.]